MVVSIYIYGREILYTFCMHLNRLTIDLLEYSRRAIYPKMCLNQMYFLVVSCYPYVSNRLLYDV